jgi:hypothetical protein
MTLLIFVFLWIAFCFVVGLVFGYFVLGHRR